MDDRVDPVQKKRSCTFQSCCQPISLRGHGENQNQNQDPGNHSDECQKDGKKNHGVRLKNRSTDKQAANEKSDEAHRRGEDCGILSQTNPLPPSRSLVQFMIEQMGLVHSTLSLATSHKVSNKRAIRAPTSSHHQMR